MTKRMHPVYVIEVFKGKPLNGQEWYVRIVGRNHLKQWDGTEPFSKKGCAIKKARKFSKDLNGSVVRVLEEKPARFTPPWKM